MGSYNLFDYFLIICFIVSISLFLVSFNSNLTGKLTEEIITSNVTIAKYLAIQFSDGLSSGIEFGTIHSLPAIDINATENYNGNSSGTLYYINVSNDGNTPVDLCIRGNAPLTSLGLDEIGLDNETYANATSTDALSPSLANEVSLTNEYVKSGEGITVGTENYYRFWLDIPASQPSGDYNNTLSFKGVQTTLSCGS